MKRLHIALLVTLAAAVWLAFTGGRTSDVVVRQSEGLAHITLGASSSSQTSTTPSAPARSPQTVPTSAVDDPILLLQPRQTLIGGVHDGAPTALFGTQTWAPPPPPPVVAKPRPPPPPVAPPLPFTYLGKQIDDGKWQVFLAQGDQTIIAVEHMIIDGTYRVDAIAPPQLNLVYLPLQKMQTLQIGGAN